MKLGEAMYQASQEGEGADAGETGEGEAKDKADEDVIDADFQEVDDEDDDKKKSA